MLSESRTLQTSAQESLHHQVPAWNSSFRPEPFLTIFWTLPSLTCHSPKSSLLSSLCLNTLFLTTHIFPFSYLPWSGVSWLSDLIYLIFPCPVTHNTLFVHFVEIISIYKFLMLLMTCMFYRTESYVREVSLFSSIPHTQQTVFTEWTVAWMNKHMSQYTKLKYARESLWVDKAAPRSHWLAEWKSGCQE